jgi:hypothetical protein
MKEGKDTTKGEQKAMWKKMQNTYAENEVQEEKKCKTGENYVRVRQMRRRISKRKRKRRLMRRDKAK